MTDWRKWGVALLMCIFSLGMFAQARVDHSNASVTMPFTVRDYFPGRCEPFQFMVHGLGTPGDNLFICSVTGRSWVKVSGSGGGASLPATTNLIVGDGAGGAADSGVAVSAIGSKQPAYTGGACPAGQHVSDISPATGARTCTADSGAGSGCTVAGTAPSTPSAGQCYYDTTKSQFGIYSGSAWVYSLSSTPGIYTNAEYDNGTCTTAATLNPANGNRQKVTLTNAQTCALTFTQPSGGTFSIQLRIVQSSVGSYNGLISGGRWPGGSVPTITATAAAVDLVTCYLDGTNSYCVATQDFR